VSRTALSEPRGRWSAEWIDARRIRQPKGTALPDLPIAYRAAGHDAFWDHVYYKTGEDRSASFKTFDTSGKSPAYLHHRKNSKARAGETGRGFFSSRFLNRTAAATSWRHIIPGTAARSVASGPPSEP